MEDDDEFGDLYTDVLKPLTTPFQSQPQQHQPPHHHPQQQIKELIKPAVTTSHQGRPIDLNVKRDDDDEEEEEDNFFGAPDSISTGKIQTLGSAQSGFNSRPDPKILDLNMRPGQLKEKSEGLDGIGSDLQARVLEKKGGDVKLPEGAQGSSGFGEEGDIDGVVEERDETEDDFVVKDENLTDKSGNVESFSMGDPMIPGLSIPGVSGGVENRPNANFDDDWDSDSEDDLQIVLNDSNHGPMGMERMGGGGGVGGMGGEDDDDEDDEDGEPLVIVADNDDASHQPMLMEEQEWGGEDVGAAGDGEKKELGEAAKVNGVAGGPGMAQKIGYSGHGYHHPFHSQFKYVRPGASPMPGAATMGPGGTPSQIRPPGSMVPLAGRGRGDWRPTGIKGSPAMQKGYHPGYGMPVWGGGALGRGLEFTLPSHKTIFEVDIDGFEEKPWRLPGVDITDFFNFGLNEESWKDYCKQLEQLRLETTMQSKIRVYESGRTEQYDPDLPPELAAAAGIQEVPSESSRLGKADAGQTDIARGPARVRPPLPTGRAIQVETGYGERLPSIDTRKPRVSDLDVIIEIVCQDSADDDTNPGNDMAEQVDKDPAMEDLRDGEEIEDLPQEDTEDLDRFPHTYSGRKMEDAAGRVPFSNSVHSNITEGNGNLPLSSETPSEYHPDSREHTPVYPGRGLAHEERRTKGRTGERSPMTTNKKSTMEERLTDDKESSVESLDGKHSPLPSSPVAAGDAVEQNNEPQDDMNNEIVLTERGSDMNNKEVPMNAKTNSDSLTNETGNHALKKHRVSRAAEQPLPQEIDEGEDSTAARSSENSRAKSGSSNFRKLRDGVEEEEVQGAHLTRMGNLKRSIGGDEDSIRRKFRDDRQENDRPRTSVKGREDLYPHKGLDPYSAYHSRGKPQNINMRKDIDGTEGARVRRHEDLHGRRTRAEDTRKREHPDETGSRHRIKVREMERNEKDDHLLRKQLDNGSWRSNHDKDMASRRRDRDDIMKSRNENIEDLHKKRRKEEAYLRREHAEKEEILQAQREASSRGKRERDDVSDQRRRDGQVRIRDEDQHRYKEEGMLQRERGERQRERDEWHRLKQLNEEIPSKKDKEEVRAGTRSGRAAEEKTWGSQSRGKDDHRSSDKEYYSKDAMRQNELMNRRDRAENESLSQQRSREEFYAHGDQLNTDERREVRHERANTRDDRAANAENYKVQERKHRENPRKGKESEGFERNSLAPSKKKPDEISGQISDMVRFKGRIEQGKSENEIHVKHLPSRKHREEASSDDELSESRRGRSKLERWTSHKERDFSINNKEPSIKLKQPEAHSGSGASVGSKLHDEASKPVEDKQHASGSEKDAAGLNNTDKKPIEDRHLDTVEKLKKRSERFKLPMPSEKEATVVKKMDNEPLPSAQSENRADSEIKAERPARKRRWTGN